MVGLVEWIGLGWAGMGWSGWFDWDSGALVPLICIFDLGPQYRSLILVLGFRLLIRGLRFGIGFRLFI